MINGWSGQIIRHFVPTCDTIAAEIAGKNNKTSCLDDRELPDRRWPLKQAFCLSIGPDCAPTILGLFENK